MKLPRTFLNAALISTLFASSAVADTYQGGGFTVTIEGFGGGASYNGCDSKNHCLYIPTASYHERGSYIWENSGYTYNMSPLGDNSGRYQLKVFNPSGRQILNQVMTLADDANDVNEGLDKECRVVNIHSGQLALRYTPNGASRAGLNNGNTVMVLREQGIWYYVRVLSGPNNRVNGLEGWVNSNYLSCN